MSAEALSLDEQFFFRIALKNRISRAEDRLQVLGFPHAEREQVTAQLERIYQYFLNTSNLDGSRGVAVFSGKGWVRAVRVPHVLRSVVGQDHRLLVPTAMLAGAVFLLAADTVARNVVAPAELSVGVITAFCGAPVFVWVLRTRARAAA